MAPGRKKRTNGSTGRAGSDRGVARYQRSARVNQVLREVLADELARLEDTDERLGLLTITAVQCDVEMRRAVVLFSSMTEAEADALAEVRVRLQAEISRQVKLKRTTLLSFAEDPAVAAGQTVEDFLRGLPEAGPAEDGDTWVARRAGDREVGQATGNDEP